MLQKEFENLSYPEILKLNKNLRADSSSQKFDITVLSNITINQVKEFFELRLKLSKVNANIQIGDYDNILQDSIKFSSSKVVVVFLELANIIEGVHYEIELYDESKIDGLIAKIKNEIQFLFKNLEKTSLVLFNKFSPSSFNTFISLQSKYETLCKELNSFLYEIHPNNVKLIDLEKVFMIAGLHSCIDYRFYNSSKALYTATFYKHYVSQVSPKVLSVLGKMKKVLILDCDNTLWKGIIGEDGIDGIEMSNKTARGKVFHEVQHMVKHLATKGVMVALCSKNNLADIEEVINSHKDIILSESDIVAKRVNWEDKATNIKAIIEELRIGADSVIFIDDSDFEINLVKEQCPDVEVFQVPKNIYMYPSLFQKISSLFLDSNNTSEDKLRTKMYQDEQLRGVEEQKFNDITEYLKSLSLQITVSLNDKEALSRLAQMTQKTNQFNLTTKRYTENDITSFLNKSKSAIYSFSAEDKFGEYGVTGLAIINKESEKAHIDSFLMSCRVIGRNIEDVFLTYIIKELKKQDIKTITATYKKTLKNSQVSDFYDRLGMKKTNESSEESKYILDLNSCDLKQIEYIKVIDKNKN